MFSMQARQAIIVLLEVLVVAPIKEVKSKRLEEGMHGIKLLRVRSFIRHCLVIRNNIKKMEGRRDIICTKCVVLNQHREAFCTLNAELGVL